jgi:hypothetical protein
MPFENVHTWGQELVFEAVVGAVLPGKKVTSGAYMYFASFQRGSIGKGSIGNGSIEITFENAPVPCCSSLSPSVVMLLSLFIQIPVPEYYVKYPSRYGS